MRSPEHPKTRAPLRRGAALAILSLAGLWLAGCSSVPAAVNPVAWYRDLSGLSKNDELGADWNVRNLAAGGAEPYPNLASVPAPPERALSTAQRAALQKSLTAERQDALQTNAALAAESPSLPQPAPQPSAPAPAASPMPAAAPAPATPRAPAAAPAAPAQVAATPGTGGPAPGPAPGPALAASSGEASKKPGPRSPRRRADDEHEAPPAESPLVSPSIHVVPQGETALAAPPPPSLTPPPPRTSPGRAPAPLPPAPVLASPAVPPPPALTPTEAPNRPGLGTAALAPRGKEPLAHAVRLAELPFAPGSSELSAADRQALAPVVDAYRSRGGILRVVGHAERRAGNDPAQRELVSYGLALGRAKTVADALTALGVPAKQVQAEAAQQSTAGEGKSSAEVYLEY